MLEADSFKSCLLLCDVEKKNMCSLIQLNLMKFKPKPVSYLSKSKTDY